MSIETLKKLVPPPPRPSEVGTIEEWQAVERQLGLVLPSDYRGFVFTYGSGLFAGFYRVYNPFAASKYSALYSSIERVCSGEREFKRDWPERVPYSIYPEQPGILPWGNDENGNNYYWLTDGSPDTWAVLSDEVRGEGFREYGCTMTEFLTNVLEYRCKALAGDYPTDKDRVFKAWVR
jgi:SMI1-KNR4 cell-wall